MTFKSVCGLECTSVSVYENFRLGCTIVCRKKQETNTRPNMKGRNQIKEQRLT